MRQQLPFAADVNRLCDPATCRSVIASYSQAPAPLEGTGAVLEGVRHWKVCRAPTLAAPAR